VRTRSTRIAWRIVVDLSQRTATTYRLGRVVRRDRVVVGKPSTPTPVGHFFVIDRMRLATWWARGTTALMLSAYSNVFQVTREDPGEIALHSTGILTDPLGSAASHGCVRFNARVIAWLVAQIPNGTPVDIRR
jgi:lipoprotein-anchoring transpeptidase ErfK/SrfK